MKQLLVATLVPMLCLFYNSVQANVSPNPSYLIVTAASNPNTAYLGVYQGTLPCTDCQGIVMELTLKENGKSKSKTFVLKQKYLGKPAAQSVYTVTGKWFLATGNKQNPKARILQLIPDGKEDLLYFELLKDGSIKMLDNRQNQLKSKHNYTLKKQRT
ncbi:copper resistance protein NlpE [Pontibacter cellulosilyticus]|uniref:Copper resistance protein NlpE N-terminal domain-containing protein n=1 Tax=Pontibacter cellulosilyticus TaxID=1720253 RepID=A0A923N6A7_9BACT|nr:copper resistance protein NlpE [Pontibacter cellulosilyticus]MBC5992517.1 copper resistance protein NlpE N-terminal domain-containing protein [Pontibacter cellulosilyticus]